MSSDIIGSIDWILKISGFMAIAVGAVGALVQYVINSRAEDRQRAVSLLESDIKISSVFSELVQVANGYAGWSTPQAEVIDIIQKNLPAGFLQAILQSDPRSIGRIFAGAALPTPTPLARQLAAAESIVNLAIKYPILLEPALIGLDVTAGFSPFAKPAYDRLCRHYNVRRTLTNWGPDWQGMSNRPDLSPHSPEKSRSGP